MDKTVITGKNVFEQLNNFLSASDFSSLILLADTNTNLHCIPILVSEVPSLKNVPVIIAESGEDHKTLQASEKLVSELMEMHADRKSLLINVGGGMVTDLGGFTASIYKRGIKFINIPTSLMAMVDASVGGKTGVNSAGVKNVIGTFSLPEVVFINPVFLKTLPERETKSAYSEIIKHILLSDFEKWNQMKSEGMEYFSEKNISSLIEHSVTFKKSVVDKDFRDNDRRLILNFGHTLGHAIEAYFMKAVEPLNHGESVALGLIGELFLSNKLAGLKSDLLNDAVNLILTIYPENKLKLDPYDLFRYLKADKKNNSAAIGFSLLNSVGKPSSLIYPSAELIMESIYFTIDATNKSHVVND